MEKRLAATYAAVRKWAPKAGGGGAQRRAESQRGGGGGGRCRDLRYWWWGWGGVFKSALGCGGTQVPGEGEAAATPANSPPQKNPT